MRIEQLMTKSPKSCQPDHTLSEAAQWMWDHDCGCLPVTAEDGSERLVGMITEAEVGVLLAMICQPHATSRPAPDQ